MKNRIDRVGTDKNGAVHFYLLDDTDIPVDNSKRRQSIVNKVVSGLQAFIDAAKKRAADKGLSPNANTSNSTKSSTQPRLSVQRPNTSTSLVEGG